MKPANNQGEVKRASIPGGYHLKARKIQYSEIARRPPHVPEYGTGSWWRPITRMCSSMEHSSAEANCRPAIMSYTTSLAVIWFF